LPHQLYIAKRVAERAAPRVLLADEVGLGKTIEAGLILHHQLITGRAERALIIVPDSLLHQWLVEMLRRFNLSFSVLDEGMCEAISESYDNPFESSQLVLCPLSFFTLNPDRVIQASHCPWDLLIIDEAHHLEWSEEKASLEYAIVEQLARVSTGLLLLTATPEQAGIESHFARLRLLDPDRYYDLASFIEEENQYEDINHLVDITQQSDFETIPEAIASQLSDSEISNIQHHIDEEDFLGAQNFTLNSLLDRHGTGRVLFRNTRQAVTGFPERRLIQHPLILDEVELTHGAELKNILQIESLLGANWIANDERIEWLTQFLSDNRDKKILLITAQAETATELEEYLRTRHAIESSVFHEHMSLIQRDRAAAYFSDTEEGAQILICSEIGSEGRNFQFASELILFDLPLNPDLLEQRIGRLDRIGQTHTININVPFYENTAQNGLLRWYNEGLNALEKTCSFGHNLFAQFNDRIIETLEQEDFEELESLIQDTKKTADTYRETIEAERNRLLELNSCRHDEAEDIIDNMLETQDRQALQQFVESFCNQFGVENETHNSNSLLLRQGDHQRVSLPMLDEDGFTATYSRETALSRDDIQFLSWEHPFIVEAFDVILNSEHGNSNVAAIKVKGIPPGSLLVEALFQVETMAPKRFQLNRYIDNSQIRVLINQQGKDLAPLVSSEKLASVMTKIPKTTAHAMIKQASEITADLISKAESVATAQLPDIVSNALTAMHNALNEDIIRLEALQEVNGNISSVEIDYLRRKKLELGDALNQASLKTNG
ncbi:MAG: RNA polymerase-associated protein RapA, partial [Sinobacterium sp.]|nr:RNA polymerase-associated protein RapA [Sinobacterium sp.]